MARFRKSTEQHIDGSSELGRASVAFGIGMAAEAAVQTPNQHPARGGFKQSDPPSRSIMAKMASRMRWY